MDLLADPARREGLLARVHAEALEARGGTAPITAARPARPQIVRAAAEAGPPSGILPVAAPAPPFWGVRALEDIDLQRVFKYLALRSLFRLSWGARNTGRRRVDAAAQGRLHAATPPYAARGNRPGLAAATRRLWLFPCYREGDDLVILSPEDRRAPVERFSFPASPPKTCCA